MIGLLLNMQTKNGLTLVNQYYKTNILRGKNMYLKFVGEDKSMGLSHGRIYDVRVKTKKNYIWVEIPNVLFGAWRCPYSSPQSFAANWEKV